MKVLEFRHIGPFDGCRWRFEYVAVEEGGTVHPIIFTPGRLSPSEVIDMARGAFLRNEYRYYENLFTDFTWYEWDQNLFDEIPYGYFPAFWRFAEEMGLTFTWFCDECGKLQVDEPLSMAGWRGNKGAGIEVEGWLCESCALEQEED